MADRFKLGRDWGREVVSYPDPAIEVLDERFRGAVIPATVIERLWTGGRWLEGPAWFGDARQLLFSDIPNNRILRWCEQTGETTVFRSHSRFANGNCRDRQGRLISCLQGKRAIERTEYDGRQNILVDRFEGRRLNAPNDVTSHIDGSIWFTDPGYGILSDYEGDRGEFELPTRIYRIDGITGELTVASDELARPNGLCFSPDYRRLYVVDTGCTDDPAFSRRLRLFDVAEGGGLANLRDFGDMAPGRGDGIRCDSLGNVWAAAAFGGDDENGVLIFAPDGTRIGHIHLPEPCSNLSFGGRRMNRVFITGGQSLYSLYIDVSGAV